MERGTVSQNKIYKWPVVTIMAYSYSLDQHVPIVLQALRIIQMSEKRKKRLRLRTEYINGQAIVTC